ncbi:MAG: DUF1616 domain-containing protein [Candidatus Bathyarchaeota archaeon]|nr:DUF1616 domain-containing protein [Candidatus Bathyarchaeum tardum]WGM89985.1 MAG: DUF1616 domain-containing protein [Candidatus Bathyarchaeum tardum]WNZ29876.1 MAG: DUF1616 domain-containing protein [Candidatus Bathyarchaeota archaeon]
MTLLESVILDVLETDQPENVEQLVRIVQNQVDASLDEIKAEIKRLHKKGMVSLEEPKTPKQNFVQFLFAKDNYWFWIIMVTSILTFASIVLIPENQGLVSYIRYVFAFVLVAFLPGYCLTKTLFPKKTTLDPIEIIVFSIGLSFALTTLMGLFLSFSSIGLTLATTLPTLTVIVVVLAMLALLRTYKKQ